ncbi:uncharacterized protein MEPE_06608 [Melanopsichium pennsylvanicum]|uniref:NAD(P)-binding domain-containing protein n=1 Tax=Melanopsichium pennsylvanicum TaxID=63383 RepID=A0AAJ4XTS0_9BASI|nr:uncharacterized protein MEPE_06608 [Melanopsichium pennsylvanicum]
MATWHSTTESQNSPSAEACAKIAMAEVEMEACHTLCLGRLRGGVQRKAVEDWSSSPVDVLEAFPTGVDGAAASRRHAQRYRRCKAWAILNIHEVPPAAENQSWHIQAETSNGNDPREFLLAGNSPANIPSGKCEYGNMHEKTTTQIPGQPVVETKFGNMHIIVVGATGLAGSRILQEATRRPEVTQINVLTRKPSVHRSHKKVHTIIHEDFSIYLDALVKEVGTATACIWALGVSTTANLLPKEYRTMTHDWPLAFAKRLTESTKDCSSRLSSAYLLAIDARSDNKWLLYQREKGRTEKVSSSLPPPPALARALCCPSLFDQVVSSTLVPGWQIGSSRFKTNI